MLLNEALSWAAAQLRKAGRDSSRLDAELAAAHVLRTTRLGIITAAPRPLTQAEETALRESVDLLAQGMPLAYVTGSREFWGYDFMVDETTLVPRPETELIIETALDADLPEACVFCDLGTGSGCLGVTLALEKPSWRGVLLESSPGAARMARRNAEALNAKNIAVIQGDMFSCPFPSESLDLVVSNPPYIAREEIDEVMPDVEKWEPHTALFSENQGLKHIKAVARHARRMLRGHGLVIIEHGYRQAMAVQEILLREGFRNIFTKKDLAGLDRNTVGGL